MAPAYHAQCYGTQQGSITVAQTGTTSGPSYSNNYSNGSIRQGSQSAAAAKGGSSDLETMGWISMGPGPSNGLCFSPTNTSSKLVYRFSGVAFSVSLIANCSGGTGTASASYNFSLEGNIYDLSTSSFVWRGNLATPVANHTVSCASGTIQKSVHPYRGLHTILVTGKTSTFSTYDKYWFIVTTHLTTQASATGTGSSATALVKNLALTLSSIRCPNC
ncbi:MAG: hypothetical protein L3K09_05020 [Thermoplasmata archaeon]|nr:hypothetical protein [Thermoplasmata archaeon]